MPQADGTILIDTEINADGMKAGSKEVEAAVRRMANSVNDLGTKARTALNKQVDSFSKLNKEYAAQAQKVDDLKKKIAEYGAQKIPTAEYQEIQAQIDQATKRMNQLIAAQERYLNIGGKTSSSSYKRMQYDIDELANTIKYAEGELRDLEASGKAFTFGNQTKQAAADMEKLAAAERKLSDMNNRLGTSYSSIKGQVNGYNNSLLKSSSAQQKAATSGNKLNKSLRNTGKSANSANFGLARMLGTSILFSFVFQAISGVMNAMKDGFTNLAQYSGTTNNSISMLWSSLERLKNSLATAFAPILDVIAPILSRFIDMLSTAASYVSMFFAFLSGKDTYTRAVAVQKDYAASLEDTAAGAQDAADATNAAADAAERYLSPLDDINKFTPADTGSGGNGGSGGGGGGGAGTGPLFEEVEITDIPILEKLKDILSQIFQPFKDAWEKEGQATIDAAKYAFSSLGELAKSVGSSILEVWTNGTGTEMLILMLQIAQNILVTIGNIATRLNEAWNTANLGTQIIQNIFNLFNIILGTVERITRATADWAYALDFTPLLSSINNLLTALQPLTSNIGAGLEWFWKNVLLPIAGWTIQEAVPAFLDMLSTGISALNEVINALKPLGEWLWNSFLQPLGEWAGDVIISALQTITDLLEKFGNWVSEHQEAVQNFAIIVGSFAAAWGLVNTAVTLWNTIGTIATAVTTAFGAAVGFLTSPIGIAIAAIGAIIAIGVLLYKNWDKIKEAASKLGEWIGEKWDWIKKKTSDVWNSIKKFLGQIWDGIKTTASNVFNGIKTTISNIWNGVKSTASNIWNGIKSTVTNIWNGLKNTASSVFNAIKSKITSIWNSIKSVTTSVWNGIKNTIKSVVNGIIGSINGMIRGVVNGINTVIRALNRLHFNIPDWVPVFGGRSFGFNIGTISAPQIPYLASGAVIPPNQEFLAVLGDQNQGNNIEAPESLIRRIVREETGNSGGNYEFIAQINRKVIFREVIEQAKLVRSQTGKNPFEMA